MQYNYDFEIASLLIMTIILLHFVFVRQFPGEKTRVFGWLLFVCEAECLMNILSCVGLANAALVPQRLNEVLAFAFFVLEGASSYLVYRYFMAACAIRGRERTVFAAAGIIPFAAFLVLVAVTPVTGFFYYFSDGSYYQGVGADYGYAYIVIFFLLDLLIVVRQHKYTTLRTKVIVCAYTAVAAAMIGLQYRYREILCTSVSNTVVLIMLYLQIQNPVVFLDTTTGIGNGTAFESQLEDRLRRKGEGYVLTIHLSKFYHIHTILGTENSNELLREIGAYLYDLCGKFHVFHTAGDAFTVFADTKEQCERLKCEIQKRFESDWVVQENRIALDMEMVVQHYPTDFKAMAEYYGMREFLLENAGKSGAQVIVEADADMIAQYRRRRKVEIAVARAIREKGFLVYYQPVYSTREKQFITLEALSRLHHPQLGWIAPDVFIQIAEKNHMIEQITDMQFRRICRFLKENRELMSRLLNVKVNLSSLDLMRNDCSSHFIRMMDEYEIRHEWIQFEITETVATEYSASLGMVVDGLTAAGIRLCLDDFGSGYANLNTVMRLPFSTIKLDRSLLFDICNDEKRAQFYQSVVETFRKMNYHIVSEGVETREEMELISRWGVDMIQGYYFSKPLPQEALIRLMQTEMRSASVNAEQSEKA